MDPLRVFYIFLIIIAIATYIYGEAMGYFRSHHYYECERISEKNFFYINTKEQYLIHITNDKNKKFRIMDLPRIISNSATVANEIGESELSNFLSNTVLPKFNERIKVL